MTAIRGTTNKWPYLISLVGVLGIALEALVAIVTAPVGSALHNWHLTAITLLGLTVLVLIVPIAVVSVATTRRWAILTTDRVVVTAHAGAYRTLGYPGAVLWDAPRASVSARVGSMGTLELQQSSGPTTTRSNNVTAPRLAREFVARYNDTTATAAPCIGPVWL